MKRYIISMISLAFLIFLFPLCSSDSSSDSSTKKNSEPVITAFTVSPEIVDKGSAATFTVTASDPDKNSLKYSFEVVSGGGTLGGTDDSTGKTYTPAADRAGGEHKVKVTVTDGKGGSAEQEVSIFVNGSEWKNVGPNAFTEGTASFTVMAVNEGFPYVAFIDGASPNKMSVMRFDGSDWLYVGSSQFSPETVDNINLRILNNTPYVSFLGSPSSRARVMRFNGSAWEDYGPQPVTNANNVDNVTFDFPSSGVPYVAFRDATLNVINIKKYSTTSNQWTSVGMTNYYGMNTAVGKFFLRLIANSEGVPYIAFRDASSNLSVMKFNSTTSDWEMVGSAITDMTGNLSFVFDEKNNPCVGFSCSTGFKVYKYDGSTWVNILNVSAAITDNSLFSFKNILYVAALDPDNGSKLTVKKYDRSTWTTVGSAGFSKGAVSSVSISVYKNVPYVAYIDSFFSPARAVVKKFE